MTEADDAPFSSRRLRRSTRRQQKEQPIVIVDLDTEDDDDDVEDDPPVELRQRGKRQKISQLTSKFNFRSSSRATTPIAISSLSRQPSRIEPQQAEQPKESERAREQDNSQQWSDKYAPSTTANVAIHARKLKEVREVLSDMLQPHTTSPFKILLLTGPAGTSKSTVVKCLSQELANPRSAERPYIEWINPIESRMSQFGDFLESVKMRVGTSKNVILVEDIPNVFHEETRVRFQQSLLEFSYADYEVPPLVICLTECDMPNDEYSHRGFNIENNYIAETVLGRRLLNSPGLKRIKFNRINFTLSKKCLSNIVVKEPLVFKSIPKEEVKLKVEEFAKFGDIRSSIFALQFWSQWRSDNNQADLCPDLGRESVMSIFHAVGKCIFGSKNEGEDANETMNHVIRDYITRADNLKLALLENYSSFAKGKYDLESAVMISDTLSLADTIRPNDVSLEISTRGVRSILEKVGSDESHHTGLTFPREWKIQKIENSVKRDMERYVELEFKKDNGLRTMTDSNLLYGFYEPMINNQRAFKNKSKLAYLRSVNKPISQDLFTPKWPYIQERLGGPFHEIYGDETVAADDETYTMSSNNASYFNHHLLTAPDGEDSDSGSEFDEDPIDDGDEEEFGDENDTFDQELLAVSQRPSAGQDTSVPTEDSLKALRQPSKLDFLNDFDDDDDFDNSDL